MQKNEKLSPPDTLNLCTHMEYALENLTNIIDEKRDNLPYFFFDLLSDPPEMKHSRWDYSSSAGRMVHAFIIGRRMTGSKIALEAEEKIKRNLLSYFSENDGLSYRKRSNFNPYHAFIHDQRSVILGLTTWLIDSDDPEIKEYAKRHVQGLYNIATDHKYYPGHEYFPDGWSPITDPSLKNEIWGQNPVLTSGRQIMPLIKYYEATGDKIALELAENFAYYNAFEDRGVDEKGNFLVKYPPDKVHFHSVAGTIAGLLRYGILVKDMKFIEKAKSMYDFTKKYASSFGWFPEFFREKEVCEACCVADMVENAILLAKAGYQKYWNDAERFIRNHLIESQLLDTSWIKCTRSKPDTEDSTYDNVAKRAFGAFAGWSLPNDFSSHRYIPYDIMNCCTFNAMHALYVAWENIIIEEAGRVYINLLLNKNSDLLEVISYLPHAGKIELLIHKEIPFLYLRIPDWVEREKIQFSLTDKDKQQNREKKWVGEYLRINGLKEKSKVKVTFPIRTAKISETIYGEKYTLEWRGDTVADIMPTGKVFPLYQKREFKNPV